MSYLIYLGILIRVNEMLDLTYPELINEYLRLYFYSLALITINILMLVNFIKDTVKSIKRSFLVVYGFNTAEIFLKGDF